MRRKEETNKTTQGSDPGITINIFWPPVESYQIPGPEMFTC